MDFELNLNSEKVHHAPLGKVVSVAPDDSLRQALGLLKQENTGALLICEGERLVGIYTERDALKVMAQMALAPERRTLLDEPISLHMSKTPASLTADESMSQAISKMAAGGLRRLPIVDDAARPTALLKVSGILRFLVDHFPKVVYTLPPKPRQATTEREGA